MNITLEQIKALPVFMDGSDGSMWLAHVESPGTRFVRLSDVLALFAPQLPKTFPDE